MMIQKAGRRLVPAVAALALSAAFGSIASAETLVEHSAEARFQLDFHVSDAVLATFLPQGWTPNVAAQGAAKDCNLRVIFIDRMTINGPDGKPLGKGGSHLVYFAAPVKDASGANAQLIIGGIAADAADAPGPFGNYLHATSHTVQRGAASQANGTNLDTQNWAFTSATGEHIEMKIQFERGTANKGNIGDTKFYSAKNPTFFQISRQEQVLDILRNTTTKPADRVKDFSIKVGGGSWSKLFDGTETVLSWDNIVWLNRQVLLP